MSKKVLYADLPAVPFSIHLTRPDLEGGGHIYIQDADGRNIVSVWGKGKEKLALANLIVDASRGAGNDTLEMD